MVIFGASGDLTHRKLIPALFDLFQNGLLGKHFAVLGFSRSTLTNEEFRQSAREGIAQYTTSDVPEEAWQEFSTGLHYMSGQFDDPASYEALRERLATLDAEHQTQGNRVFYLATPPELFPVDHGAARRRRLPPAAPTRRHSCGWSSRSHSGPISPPRAQLNRSIQEVFDESHVYRIDHYLGKETVQNILAFRLSNGIFEPIWNRNFVDHVQLTVAETVGVERRGGYYDQIGAFRDMVENHMLQLLTIVAMEPPVVFEAEPVRDEKLKVLKALRRIRPEQTGELTLRGQYTAGVLNGQPVASYRGEEKVAPDSFTETYVVAKLQIDNWRWAGTPFYLRHGKRLPKRATEIAITFKRAPQMFFPGEERLEPNVLAMRIQPDEGISLRIGAKQPGPTMQLREVDMDFFYGSSFGPNAVDQGEAYERLLLDAMLGDRTLFTRADEVEQAWDWAEDVLDRLAGQSRQRALLPGGRLGT